MSMSAFFNKNKSLSNVAVAISSFTILLTLASCGGSNSTPVDSAANGGCSAGINTYFVMNDGVTGDELYKTNGETDCTSLLLDMNKNSSSGTDDRLRWDLGNGTILFIANDGVVDDELWRHDENGTALVIDHVKDGGMRPTSGKVIEGGDVIGSGLPLNGRLYYVFNNQLWSTDGSEAGTNQLQASTDISQLIAYNDLVYFSSRMINGSYSLWRTDGSVAGTTEFSASKTTLPSILNNKLYYMVDGITLVQTDGTQAGTTQLGSITTGTVISMVTVNNMLLMSVRTTTGSELYVSDGATAPVLLANLNTVGNSYVQLYRQWLTQSAVYFTVPDANGIFSLWKSDGTELGTINFGVINNTNNPSVRFFTEFNGKTYFQANDGVNGAELWEIDGAVMSMLDLDKAASSNAYSLTVFNNKLYFFAKDTVYGRQLWVHDGTLPQRVTDVFTYSEGGLRELVIYKNSMYFTGTDIFGRELWKSDGSAAGTVRITDINPYGNSIYIFGALHMFNGLLFFEANDGVRGRELWKSDGTAINTQITMDINQQNADTRISGLFKFKNKDYVFANDGAGQALWAIDDAGIVIVKRIPGDARIEFTQEHNGFVYFDVAGSNALDGIWRTDGTANNTVRVLDAATMNAFSNLSISGMASYKNEFYFLAHHLKEGFGLYKLNTSNNEVSNVKTINPAGSSSRRFGILVNLNKMIFMADDGVSGLDAWVSDGTTAGTKILFDPIQNKQQGDSSRLLTSTGSKLYFRSGEDLWESDGVETNQLVTGFKPLNGVELNGNVYFIGLDTTVLAPVKGSTSALYKYDGTQFSLLKSLSTRPNKLIAYKGKVYFGSIDPANPKTHSALWESDGTIDGTRVLKSIYVKEPAVNNSIVERPLESNSASGFGDIVLTGDRLYFIFSDSNNGKELWVSDGTAEGTQLVKDINPGPADGVGINPLSLVWDYY